MRQKAKQHPPNILVAPLDWGLGHASRCIPLIQRLIDKKARLYIAATGPQAALLRESFPDLPFIQIPSYNIRYGKSLPFLYSVLPQIPRLLRTIRDEHEWLQHVIRRFRIHGVLSDNRYGLWTDHIPSVIITHQLRLPMPPFQWLSPAASAFLGRYINRFTECWIPDLAGEDNLSGRLSHLAETPSNYHFIGPLSRFSLSGKEKSNGHPREKLKVLAILSGPEPQRSVLEKILLQQAKSIDGKMVIIQGKPETTSSPTSVDNVTVLHHVDTPGMQELIQNAEVIVCRAGYSSIMDLSQLGKKAILIPTPGQGEQEFLARRLHRSGHYYSVRQKDFSLPGAIKLQSDFSPLHMMQRPELLDQAIERFLALCNAGMRRT